MYNLMHFSVAVNHCTLAWLAFPAGLLQRVKGLLCDKNGYLIAVLEKDGLFQMVMSEFNLHEEQVSEKDMYMYYNSYFCSIITAA